MSSKLILLKEKFTIPREIRNLGGYEFSLQDFAYSDFDQDVRLYSFHFCEKGDLSEIWSKSLALLDILNRALRLYYLNTDQNLYLNPVSILDDNGNSLYNALYQKKITRLYPFDLKEKEKNITEGQPKPRKHFLNDVIFLSIDNSDVFDLLILCSLEQNFTNLYKLFETVSFYFKTNLNIELKSGLLEHNIPKAKIGSFKQTANHGNYPFLN